MDLRLSDEQQQLVDAFANLYAKQSSIERVRAAEPAGFDRDLWDRLGEMGVVAMAVPETLGGWGASLLDLGLIAEQQGRFLAAAPVIEAQVAARLLARIDTPAASELLTAALAGDQLVSLALHPAAGDQLRLVPAGLVADRVVARVDDHIVAVTPNNPTPVENLGSLPLADLPIDGAVELGSGPAAVAAFEVALDEWCALTANALVGIGARGLEIGVEYVKEREAFGRVIGSFQSIAHKLADSAAALDGARLLAWEAAWAFAEEPVRARQLANMAYGFAYETARDATYRALHFHGGYGFMMEYDIQLYWRRARAWANVFGDAVRAYGRVADRRYDGDDADFDDAGPSDPPAGIDFRLGASSDHMREEARAFLADAVDSDLHERIYRTGVHHDHDFTQKLREKRWLAPSWPVELGGLGLDPLDMVALHEEMTRVGAPTYANGTTMMVAKLIATLGSEEQKAEILPKAFAGEIIIVLGFSEPEAGSDVANAKTRAVRDGDEWVISGQKMFTTNGHIGDYAFLLTRTDSSGSKHEGLTMFLVPLKQDGFEAQAVYTLSGERTNITFYNELRVPDAWRIGEVGDGWSVMTHSLQDEHSSGFAVRSANLLRDLEAWAQRERPEGGPPIDDPIVRVELGRIAAEMEAGLLLQHRSAWMPTVGVVPVAEGPMAKLFTSEAIERHAQRATELMGPEGLRSYFEPTAPQGGRIEHAMRFSLGTTIYAGTSEVQRNIIAQRGLGLPRPR